MATNKTVTVTVLPTLTGDTVASYNVYEGVSGTTLLGTMSVAEAAAGKVFAFTDGIVHSVKVQTVWTTAGASTLRSTGVPLDLSSTLSIVDFSLGAMVDLTKTGDTYQPGSQSWILNYAISIAYSGDFEFAVDVANGNVLGFGRTNSNNSYNSTTKWEFSVVNNVGVAQVNLDGATVTIDTPHTWVDDGTNNQMVLRRVGATVTLLSRVLGVDTLIHTFGTPVLGASTGTVYLHITNGKLLSVNNPTFLQL